MTSRDAARRHRGRHKYKAPERTPPEPKTIELSPIMPDDATAEAFAYWMHRLDGPLFVYFIQAEDGGPVKIGQAQDPLSRLADLQCANAAKLVIRAVVLAAQGTEKRLHFDWTFAHVRGEWYGDGHEDTVIALAQAASAKQVLEHARGAFLPHLTEGVCWEIRPSEPGWRAA